MAEEYGPKFALYFSHSWKPHDVELNLLTWNEVGHACELLVDAPDEAGPNPPYYISRIEELLRRSDLFLSVLTFRDEPAAQQGDGADASLSCSPWALFEVRLAERFNIPRLVLYERRTGFRAPDKSRATEAYLVFDRGTHDHLPDQRTWDLNIAPKIRQWIEWAAKTRKPLSFEQSTLALNLLPPETVDGLPIAEQIERSLEKTGYEQIEAKRVFRSNTEAFQILHHAGLVIADMAIHDPIASQLFIASHVLGVPTIRTLFNQELQPEQLPWLLRGHPGGYQHDVVSWRRAEDLPAQIEPRARAMFRISRAFGDEATREYLNSKRYSQFFVFISHTLKPPQRNLVEEVFKRLRSKYVIPFEYHLVNEAGDDWQKALDEQLGKTTHFVALLSDGYEQSKVCTYEFDEILKRGSQVVILPFMVQGRSVPHPKLGDKVHHRLLDATDPRTNAETVVSTVMRTLDDAISMTSGD